MDLITGFIVLLGCQLAGEALVQLTGLPVPGPVAGMVLLLTVLLGRRRPLPGVEPVARGLLGNLSLLFVPAGVGVSVHLPRLAADGLALGLAIVASTVIGIAVAALIMTRLAPGGRP